MRLRHKLINGILEDLAHGTKFPLSAQKKSVLERTLFLTPEGAGGIVSQAGESVGDKIRPVFHPPVASYIFDTIRDGREGTPGSSQISTAPAGNFDVDLCHCILFPS